jgi:hypothetical protein
LVNNILNFNSVPPFTDILVDYLLVIGLYVSVALRIHTLSRDWKQIHNI